MGSSQGAGRLAPSEFRGLPEIITALQDELTAADQKSFQLLENLFYGDGPTSKYENIIEKAFASPLYSDACKQLFAASHIDSELVLSLGDKFLTEEIILGYVRKAGFKTPYEDYIRVLMSSSHLSENIIEAEFGSRGTLARLMALELTPDRMITPKLMHAWKITVPYDVRPSGMGVKTEGRSERLKVNLTAAAARIRQVHPEYEGFPDEWVMKVFCGE